MRHFLRLTFACLTAFAPINAANAKQPAAELTSQEQALCRSDAIRFCFTKIGRAEAMRTCLRDKKAKLSASCRGLIESRGN